MTKQKKDVGGQEVTRVEVMCDDVHSTIEFDFALTDEQKDKVVDAALQKFIKH